MDYSVDEVRLHLFSVLHGFQIFQSDFHCETSSLLIFLADKEFREGEIKKNIIFDFTLAEIRFR